MGRVDHVAVAVADVEVTARRLREAFGLGAVAGVTHAGRGTANWVVPFADGTYIELLYAVDPERPAAGFVMAAAERGDRLTSWAIASEDVAADAERLDLEVIEGAVVGPDGTSSPGWRTAGEPPPYSSRGGLPFFITYDFPGDVARAVEEQRSRRLEAARHDVAVIGISGIQVSGDEAEVRRWVAGHDVDVRVSAGRPRLLGAVLALRDGGELVLGHGL